MRRWWIVLSVLLLAVPACGDDGDGASDASDQSDETDPAAALADADSCEELLDTGLEVAEDQIDELSDVELTEPFLDSDVSLSDDELSDAAEEYSDARDEFDDAVAEAFEPFDEEFFDASDVVGCGDETDAIDEFCDDLRDLEDETEEGLDEGEHAAGENLVGRLGTNVCDWGG